MAANSGAAGEPWTVRRVLDWTIEHLKKHGSDSPRLDAEVLLAHARGCDRIQLYTRYDEPLGDEERAVMRELVQRRAGHEPVAYLVGHREFFGLDFQVGPGVLVPRPETETLVLEVVERLMGHEAPRILDLCTGTGCVAVALAKNLPSARVTAVELDETAMGFAEGNVERHELASRVDLRQGDLFEALDAGTFHAIASNPPYVTTSEFDELDPDVRLHEPRTALVAGADGLDVVRRLVAEAPGRLEPGGWLLVELDPAQAGPVAGLFRDAGLLDVTTVRDANGADRVVLGKQG